MLSAFDLGPKRARIPGIFNMESSSESDQAPGLGGAPETVDPMIVGIYLSQDPERLLIPRFPESAHTVTSFSGNLLPQRKNTRHVESNENSSVGLRPVEDMSSETKH